MHPPDVRRAAVHHRKCFDLLFEKTAHFVVRRGGLVMYRHMFPQTLEEQFSGEAYQVATFCLAHHLVPQPMDETPPPHVAWELRVGIRIVQGWKEGMNRFKIFIPEGFRWGRPVAESDSLDGIMAAL